jgi:hypothetical protein
MNDGLSPWPSGFVVQFDLPAKQALASQSVWNILKMR